MRPLPYLLVPLGMGVLVCVAYSFSSPEFADLRLSLGLAAVASVAAVVVGVKMLRSGTQPGQPSGGAGESRRQVSHDSSTEPQPNTAITANPGSLVRKPGGPDDPLPEPDVRLRPNQEPDAAAAIALFLPVVGLVLAVLLRSQPGYSALVGWCVVVLSAILLGIDAAHLGRIDVNGRKRESPLVIFFGVLLFWVVVFPLAFYRRRHFGRSNWGGWALVFTFFFIGAGAVASFREWNQAEQERRRQAQIIEKEQARLAKEEAEDRAFNEIRQQHAKEAREHHQAWLKEVEERNVKLQAELQRRKEQQEAEEAEEKRLKDEAARTQLLIVSRRNGNAEIFLVNADGSGLVNLSKNKAENRLPAWSPDGRKIAFDSTDPDGRNVYVMDADGSNARRLTKRANAWHPAWSPDGKKIAFSSEEDKITNVMLMEADGSALRAVGPGHDPAWSPDGKKILFTRRTAGGFRPAVMDSDGANARDLATIDNEFGNTFPAWSPDSKKIAWTEKMNGTLQLVIADADGGNLRQATNWGTYNRYVAWSSDSSKIAYQHSLKGGIGQLYIMDVRTRKSWELLKTEPLFEGARPAWRPTMPGKN